MRPYKFWTNKQLEQHLVTQAKAQQLPRELVEVIRESFTTDLWDPVNDYDGCTAVQDMYHPCISCYVHDYLWITGQGGKESDYIFKELMKLEGVKPGRVKRRYFAVRVAWLFYYQWAHYFKKNVNPLTDKTKALLQRLGYNR